MMLKDDAVLLVRLTYLPGWFIPGSGLQRGETLEQAARREVREEGEAELGQLHLMGVYTSLEEWKTDHNILFICRDFTLSGQHDNEIAEVRFFDLDDLPEGLWPGHRCRLQEIRSGAGLPTFGEW